jgi:PAS domain S-box-containing protein
MWIYDLETLRFLAVNQAAVEHYGYSESEFLRSTIKDIRPADELPRLMQNLSRVRPSVSEKSGLWRHRRKDGSLIDVEVVSHALEWQDRACRLVMATDVTERQRAQSQLFESLEMLRHIADHVSHRIYWKDRELRYLGCNVAYAHDAGLPSPCHAIGHTDEELGRAEWTRVFAVEDRGVLQTGVPKLNYRIRLAADGEEERWLVVNRLPLHDREGTVIGVLATYEDITERVRRDAQVRELQDNLERRVSDRTAELLRANEALESFSYSVSHDLRAPLRAVTGFSELLEQENSAQLDGSGRAHLGRIRRAAERMDELIQALLGMARLSRHELRLQRTDLAEMAQGIARELLAADGVRRVEFDFKRHLPTFCDPGLVRIALQNLLENAWKYTAVRETAVISLGACANGGGQAFYVRDNGVGFDMTYAHKLFEPFQRLHSLKEFEGAGIGLATAKRIIDRHGGRIWAEARPDEGATFYFTLGS